MKGFLTFIIVTIILLITAGGAWYYFTDGELFGVEEETPRSPSSSDETNDAWSGSTTDDSSCPEGLVCFGSDDIPTVPTVKLGSNDVYAAEGTESQETQEDQETDEESSEEPTAQDSQATEGNTPRNVTVTNKDTQFWTVTWVTNDKTKGHIKYGVSESDLNKTAYDDRDSGSDNISLKNTHHVTVSATSEELNLSNLTYYFTIFSDDIEFKDVGYPYSYKNAPFTSTPSLPKSVTITSDGIFAGQNDYYAIARLSDSYGDMSSSISQFFNSSDEIDLVIGSARTEGLSSYFPDSDDNLLEVKLYGPSGYTGLASNVRVGDIGDGKLSVDMISTGYDDSNFASSGGSSYTILGGASSTTTTTTTATTTTTEATTTATTTTTTTQQAPSEYDADQEEELPETGIDNSWGLKAIYGISIFLIGLMYISAYIVYSKRDFD